MGCAVRTISSYTLTPVASLGETVPEIMQTMTTSRHIALRGCNNIWALGDAVLIPMTDTPTERSDFAPPTAQFAVREALALAANVEAVLSGEPPKPFV